jgi:hypothetical protein
LAVLLSIGRSGGNPIVGPANIPARVYISSEHLNVTVSSNAATFEGTFTFATHALSDFNKNTQQTFMELPIWFPQQFSDDPTVAAFWNAFGTNMLCGFTPPTTNAFEKAIGLKLFSEKQIKPSNGFFMFYQDGDRQPSVAFFPREQRIFREIEDPGFCCLVFRIGGLGEAVQSHAPVTVSYRQPLLKTEGKGRFFYLPIFENLPKDISTTDTNRYSITLTAATDCSLTVTNGKRRFKVRAGHSLTLAPEAHQAIRAVVTKQKSFWRWFK